MIEAGLDKFALEEASLKSSAPHSIPHFLSSAFLFPTVAVLHFFLFRVIGKCL